MSSVHAHHRGRRVTSIATQSLRLAWDFPGWGAPDYEAYLIPTVDGLGGVVTYVESHGSNPWTRYSIHFDDDTRTVGAVPGRDFQWAQ